MTTRTYNTLLLAACGFGGLLYGIDVGIISSALPYMQATTNLTAAQMSIIVAAVLAGTVPATLFAGVIADAIGRKTLMILSGLAFLASVPMIVMAHGYTPLLLGRLLQGVGGGFLGVVVPLYLAECLLPADRGKGTGIFQWVLTVAFVLTALIGDYFSNQVKLAASLHNSHALFMAQDHAWRSIFFWAGFPAGILFTLGALVLSESPRWLYRRGRTEAALAALKRSRGAEQAETEFREMAEVVAAGKAKSSAGGKKISESLLQRKYVIPFLLACVILSCNQLTGINSIIPYNASILVQSGLSDIQAHWGYTIFAAVNVLMTTVALFLVDRKGRKFLLTLGTAGVVIALVGIGMVFRSSDVKTVDAGPELQQLVQSGQTFSFTYNAASAQQLLQRLGAAGAGLAGHPTSLTILYSCGGFHNASNPALSTGTTTFTITHAGCVPASKMAALNTDPFASLSQARRAPLKIEHALITPLPSAGTGWGVAALLWIFMGFFAIGPGVVVWLALSELMPTRIRSNGMSIALLLNQTISTVIAALFLPMAGAHGYSTMFFFFAACTVVYFLTAAFWLPETKGKTLEEIEAHFAGHGNTQAAMHG